jgi:hypothetical protein
VERPHYQFQSEHDVRQLTGCSRARYLHCRKPDEISMVAALLLMLCGDLPGLCADGNRSDRRPHGAPLPIAMTGFAGRRGGGSRGDDFRVISMILALRLFQSLPPGPSSSRSAVFAGAAVCRLAADSGEGPVTGEVHRRRQAARRVPPVGCQHPAAACRPAIHGGAEKPAAHRASDCRCYLPATHRHRRLFRYPGGFRG